jgi:hypothetical protein
MPLPLLYRCPITGLNAQGWVADDLSDESEEFFEPLTCLACGQVHLVSPKTGRVLGSDSGASSKGV